MQRSRNHSVFGRNTRVLSEAVESSLGPCKLDHGGLEPNAVAIYEEVMYRILPLIHSSHRISDDFGFFQKNGNTSEPPQASLVRHPRTTMESPVSTKHDVSPLKI